MTPDQIKAITQQEANRQKLELLDRLHSKTPKNNWLQGSELFYGFDEGVKDYQSAIQSERKKLGSE